MVQGRGHPHAPSLPGGGGARFRVGVDLGASANLVGALIKYLSVAFLLPIGVALGYREPVWPFVLGGAVSVGIGAGLELVTRGKERVGAREGFLVVAVTWLLGAALIALPYVLSGEQQLDDPLDAFFEAMSGMTTTGASILTDVGALNHSLAMWRQFSQWIGGMGIIVLAIAVLPRLRVGGRQLFASEAPGHEFQTLTSSIRETARVLWVLYIGLTALEAVLLAVLGWTGLDSRMNLFDAVAHAFSTMPTGGFSTHARSVDAFGAASQWTIVAFMFLAGTNFVLLYGVVRRRVNPLRDEEFRTYAAVLTFISLIVFASLWANDLFGGRDAFGKAVFQTVSMATTTGYANADYTSWTPLTSVLLVVAMFVGGMALSTAGSIKVVRHLMLTRLMRRELDQTIHPEIVRPVRFNQRVVDEPTLRALSFFVLLYIALFVVGTIGISIESARAGVEVTPFDAVSVAATTLGNVGPGFGFAGPIGSFEPFSDPAKVVMIVLMWLGRLELITVAVLFTRRYWRA